MKQTRIKDISDMTGVHVNTLRRWADKGIINSRKDFRGWRFFPEPVATVKRIQGLLNGDIQLEEQGGN